METGEPGGIRTHDRQIKSPSSGVSKRHSEFNCVQLAVQPMRLRPSGCSGGSCQQSCQFRPLAFRLPALSTVPCPAMRRTAILLTSTKR